MCYVCSSCYWLVLQQCLVIWTCVAIEQMSTKILYATSLTLRYDIYFKEKCIIGIIVDDISCQTAI